jgi:hypothetical protein
MHRRLRLRGPQVGEPAAGVGHVLHRHARAAVNTDGDPPGDVLVPPRLVVGSVAGEEVVVTLGGRLDLILRPVAGEHVRQAVVVRATPARGFAGDQEPALIGVGQVEVGVPRPDLSLAAHEELLRVPLPLLHPRQLGGPQLAIPLAPVGDGPAAADNSIAARDATVGDGALWGAGIPRLEDQGLAKVVDALMELHRHRARQPSGGLEPPDGLAGALEGQEGAIGATGVGSRQRPGPGVLAVRRDMPGGHGRSQGKVSHRTQPERQESGTRSHHGSSTLRRVLLLPGTRSPEAIRDSAMAWQCPMGRRNGPIQWLFARPGDATQPDGLHVFLPRLAPASLSRPGLPGSRNEAWTRQAGMFIPTLEWFSVQVEFSG